jgi:hypothetical protein
LSAREKRLRVEVREAVMRERRWERVSFGWKGTAVLDVLGRLLGGPGTGRVEVRVGRGGWGWLGPGL